MSLASSTHSLPPHSEKPNDEEMPFHHQPSYITLSRTLIRLSHNLLPLSPSNNTPPTDLTADQQLTLRDLLCPLPYHRTKTLHTIEHARTLLLQLEQSAQHIKIQRVKRDAVRDLAEKRKVIRKLRAVVDELEREAERREKERAKEGVVVDDDGGEVGDYEDEGETVEELLGLPPLLLEKKEDHQSDKGRNGNARTNGNSQQPEPLSLGPSKDHHHPVVQQPLTSTLTSTSASTSTEHQPKSDLFNLRQRRRSNPTNPDPTTTTTTAAATTAAAAAAAAATTEATLLHHDRPTQASLTSSLVSLAQELKAQSLTLHSTLTTTDRSYLDRALAGLDANVSGMESASKKMGLLKRMSEGEGWWGRVMLYLWIWGLWALAVLLVFAGPKLRF